MVYYVVIRRRNGTFERCVEWWRGQANPCLLVKRWAGLWVLDWEQEAKMAINMYAENG